MQPRFSTGRLICNTLYDGDRFIGSCTSQKDAEELVRLANRGAEEEPAVLNTWLPLREDDA